MTPLRGKDFETDKAIICAFIRRVRWSTPGHRLARRPDVVEFVLERRWRFTGDELLDLLRDEFPTVKTSRTALYRLLKHFAEFEVELNSSRTAFESASNDN